MALHDGRHQVRFIAWSEAACQAYHFALMSAGHQQQLHVGKKHFCDMKYGYCIKNEYPCLIIVEHAAIMLRYFQDFGINPMHLAYCGLLSADHCHT